MLWVLRHWDVWIRPDLYSLTGWDRVPNKVPITRCFTCIEWPRITQLMNTQHRRKDSHAFLSKWKENVKCTTLSQPCIFQVRSAVRKWACSHFTVCSKDWGMYRFTRNKLLSPLLRASWKLHMLKNTNSKLWECYYYPLTAFFWPVCPPL